MVVLVEAALIVLILCLLFIMRLYFVVNSGFQPGTKGSAAVLVVAGSGNVEYINFQPCTTVASVCVVLYYHII